MRRVEAMQLPLYQVDAFTGAVFGGNPAAVCPLADWLPEAQMQAIAAENNLSETAFFVPEGEDYGLRWFTPVAEVDLCGHATLATGFIIMTRLDPGRDQVGFATQRAGRLTVARRDDGRFELDFPALSAKPASEPAVGEALGAAPSALLEAKGYVAVFDRAQDVADLKPDFAALQRLDGNGVIATAPGEDCDFVSRYFAPKFGIPEDPVTGSAHCTSAPYWAERLGKNALSARQISARGGVLACTVDGERVRIAGEAALYLEGTIHV
jgi:PhzF family phenazine biosynthesis protein